MALPFTYLTSAALSDVGRRRKNNEDSLVRFPGQGVFCVADGMGGAQGGEIASKAVVDALQAVFTESQDAPFAVTAAAAARLTARAMNRASQWIKAYTEERGLTGCGSTAVVLVFDRVTPSRARVLHAGDSRAYLYRAGKLVQLSTDHSVAAAAGLSDETTLPAMFRGVITRAVGLDDTVLLEETPCDVQANDLFFLCSDGLSRMVSDKRLQKVLHKHRAAPLETLAQTLIDEALKAGGEDNVSVVLVRVADTLPQAPTMEIQPQTLALEAAEATVPVAAPSSDGDFEAEAPTRETGQTADTACTAPERGGEPTEEKISPVTPPTPFSDGGVTPVTSSQTAGVRPPKRGRRFFLLGLVVLALVALLVGILLFTCPSLIPSL